MAFFGFEKFSIGSVRIANPFVLAPMLDITTPAFRLLCKKNGAGLVCTEMQNAFAIIHEKKVEISKGERPVSLQLIGGDEKKLVSALDLVEKKADIIDLNMGCPSRDVFKAKAGGFLSKDKAAAVGIAKALCGVSKKPVTVKIRIGFDKRDAKISAFAIALERAGILGISVHARTVAQGYSGRADWSAISEIKNAVSIPVIGNGDIFSPLDAKKMIEETKCDAVMLGRAAMKNPLVFKQCVQYFKTGKFAAVGKGEKIRLIKSYLRLAKKFDEGFALQKLHSVAMAFDFEDSAKFRDRLSHAKTENELQDMLCI